MPYSDNMYSMGDDSDGESYADQLSPSDGYFASSSSSHAVPNVPNVLVPDPTLQQTSELDAESSKAREAEAERLSSNTTRSENYHNRHNPVRSGNYQEPSHVEQHGTSSTTLSRQQYNPTFAHTHSPSSASSTPLRSYPTRGRTPSVYSDAPPAYSPSPTTPFSPTNLPSQSRTYNTFTTTTTMGVAEIENERLLGRGPESIGQPGDEEIGGTPHWSRRVRRRLPTWLSWKMIVIGVLVLIVSIGFLASSFRIYKEDGDHKKTIGAQPVEQAPPDDDAEPVTDPGTGEPVVATPFHPTYCRDAQYRFDDQILSLNFDKQHNVTFIEDQHSHTGVNQVRVAGQINVRRLDSGGNPRMVLEIATNDKNVLLDVFADEEAQAMKVSVPKKYDGQNPNASPCVEMRATIWVPEGGEIGVLALRSIHLDILFLDDLTLNVSDFSQVSSVVGDVTSGAERPISYNNTFFYASSPPDYTFVPARDSYVFDSRIIEVSTTSGKIGGNWPLYDMLGLHTTSGDIKVSITPKEELATDPKSAVLSLSSISGAIYAAEPIYARDRIPARDYLVDVKSTSGGIHAALAFGPGIQVKSTASDIALGLLPVMNDDKLSPTAPAQLETATTSGTTAIRVLEPQWFGTNGAVATRPLDCLKAVHKSTSGDIGLRYPQAWEGYLQAQTTSGKLKVKGRDVKVIRSVGGWPGSKLEAQKGPNRPGSTVQVHALMGDMDAVIGRE
ncbi:hypothetical protein F5Y04DRAFT_245525 [Hypomontagnella monticulosa]|nr:hypothetical protein F5Y04DRAFT_245525 [Hypomontagnella monticulosa]